MYAWQQPGNQGGIALLSNRPRAFGRPTSCSQLHQHRRHVPTRRLSHDRRIESDLASIPAEIRGDLYVGLEVDDGPAAGLFEREVQHAFHQRTVWLTARHG